MKSSPCADGDFCIIRFSYGILKLVLLYVMVLLFAAVFTPVVHPCLKSFGVHVGFGRVFDRLRYLGLLACLPFVWKLAELPAGIGGLKSMGWGKWKTGLLLAGVGATSVLLLGAFLTNGFPDFALPSDLGLTVAKTLLAALVIALAEELIFRGLLQNFLVKQTGVCAGILATSFLFAFLHGRPPTDNFMGGWLGSFSLMLNYLSGFPPGLPPIVFVNLVLLGITLGTFYARSKSLVVSMGLHFGVVASAVLVMAFLRSNDIPSMGLLESPYSTFLLMVWVFVAIIWPMGKRSS